jgi:hypothetical protein
VNSVLKIFNKESLLPLLAGMASGLYPWAFYYSNNFKFVNSWEHVLFFLSTFVLLPTVGFYLLFFLMRNKCLSLYKNVVLPFFSSLVFFYLAMIALFAFVGYKKILLAVFLAILVSVACGYFRKLYTKILAIQFLMVLTTVYSLFGTIYPYFTVSDAWIEQPEAISKVKFEKKPDIFVIQPDGYVNFSELKKGEYNFDNSEFETWLKGQDFYLYKDFRSNYTSTLTSNSSMFAMKHHYLNKIDERKIIMDVNPVVKIFKKNGYKTHFLAEVPYLMVNRPNISFDYTNIDLNDVPFLSKGFGNERNILDDLPLILNNEEGANFYFIEKILPGHIATLESVAKSIEEEREAYLDKVNHANEWLKEIISMTLSHNPDALIIIVADHGGYVGWDYSQQTHLKTQDRDLLYSAFSSALAIKWPNNELPDSELSFNSSVNLFINLFAYLSNNDDLKEHTHDDSSFLEIKYGAPNGIYKVIDTNGNIVFEKQN